MDQAARLAILAIALPAMAHAAGDVQDQFYRHVELKNKTFEPHLPGETVDHFTGTLKIVQEDLFLPGKAGLDLRIVRAYSSKIWGRADALDPEPLLAEKDPSPLGYGWSIHMGRLHRPYATGQALACGGGDYPVYEASDGSARTFYPTGMSSKFVSRDSWTLDTQCSTQQGSGACITTTTGEKLEFAKSEQYDVGVQYTWPLTARIDVFGNDIVVSYQGQGRIDTITDTWSRTVTFAYSSCGPRQCLDSITASGPGGSRQVDYTYTSHPVMYASGNRWFLTGVDPAAGPGYAYTYATNAGVGQNKYALESITYPNGGTTTYTYDWRNFFTGREDVPMAVVVNRTTAGRALPAATWTYQYSAPQGSDYQTTTVTRPDTLRDVYRFFGFGYPARMNATGHVWKVGLQASVSHANGAQLEESTWEKGTDVATANYAAPFYGNSACPGWLWDTKVQSPILTRRVTWRGASRYEMEAIDHDDFGQPGTVTETGEAQRTSGRPVRITTYKYDYDKPSHQVIGRVSSQRTCQGTGMSDCMVTSRTFMGPQRRMDSETVKGVTTRYRYHPSGDLNEVTNALNQTLTLSAYDFGLPTQLDYNGAYTIDRSAYWDGSLRSESSGRGDVTNYTYDAAGRLDTVTPPGNNDASTYDYDPAGERYSVTRGSGSGAFVETTELDGLGRVTSSWTSLGNRTTRIYDPMGRVVFTSYGIRNNQPEVGERFDFDGLGRPTVTWRRYTVSAHHPLAGACAEPSACKVTVSYLADHCRSTTVDRATNEKTTTRACFDSFADPSEERLRVLTDAANKSWSYAYDVDGNLETFTAPKAAGNRSLTYTGRFFVSSETSGPRGKTEVTRHDDLGHPLEQTDATGARTTFEYADPLARPTLTQYGSGSDDDVTRTYDRDVLDTVSSVRGGTYTYGYDELNRTTSVTWDFAGETYTTGYDYDAAGCLKTLTYPTGTVASMTCDAQGRPTRIDRVAGGVTQNMARSLVYHPMGRLESMTLGNGRVVSTGIVNGRVTSIRTPGVLDLTFAYDGADNVTRLTDAIAPPNTLSLVKYDALDRIYDVTTTAGLVRYRYDELGNRIEKTVPGEGTTTYHYNATTNRLSWSSGPGALPAGTLAWTPAERLRSTSDGSSYSYDALGRRVARQRAAEMIDVVYHYDVSGRLLAETKPDGTPVREYFYAADQLVAVHGCPAVNSSGCNDTQWYHTDHLGSVRARTDAAGTVVAPVAYQPWGETPASAAGPVLFNGRPLDAGMGLYDLGARSYAPAIGRFVSADTVWSRDNPQGTNPYAYVLNNPLKHTDPDGHWAQVAIMGGIGFVVGAALAANEYRDLEGWDFVTRVAVGGAYTAVGYILVGPIAGSFGGDLANQALTKGLHLPVAPPRFQVQSPGAPGERPAPQSSQVDAAATTRDLLGTAKSSAPDGGTPSKGVQGGKPVAPSPLSNTPDAGSSQKAAPQGKVPDAGQPTDAKTPPQYWRPIGPYPELHP